MKWTDVHWLRSLRRFAHESFQKARSRDLELSSAKSPKRNFLNPVSIKDNPTYTDMQLSHKRSVTAVLRTILAAVIFSCPALAKFGFGFGLGVKGGVPFTDLLEATGTINGMAATGVSTSNNYLIGPVAELRIPLGFAFEVDGIYRHTDYTLTGPVPLTGTATSWEIPYLAKFRFPIPLLKPFISAGGAYRTFNNLPTNTTPTHNAFVVGGGLELRISRLRLSGEARYLHWNGSSVNTYAKLAQNQGEVLFGIMF
jgi:Outer membrane protein beta-barrel domain